VFLFGMALLQAWPGRGFWQGQVHGQPGSLASMTASMASTPQPHVLADWVSAFTNFDQAHGLAVNLVAVLVLAVTGALFVTTRPRLIRPALVLFLTVCLADWVLIEDLGFFGGVGTDPNSMIPFALLAIAGYLAVAREPEPELAAEPREPTFPPIAIRARIRAAIRPAALGSAGIGSVASLGAIGVIILGAAPMAAAQANPVADTILAQAIDGSSAPQDYAAPTFSLISQRGSAVTLASLRGKVVLLTFLDPVCTSDCPLIAQEFRQAGQLLGAASTRVELVAIVANPVDYQLGYTRAFDAQEDLTGVRNWLYLTGSPGQLQKVWGAYGIAADIEPAGGMIAHNDIAFAIDARGRVRQELDFDPGPGTTATESSFAAELTDAARTLLAQR
jgi:cytochrome oxidase Cu insertion factor (SCO1/SenC/PrrC family)